jgi:NAD(P)-dependent dehydrogenase (short-subunit alcohol dehydrogenase family)
LRWDQTLASAETSSRVVLVTGAGSGIGAAIAHRFLTDGYRAGLLDLDQEALDRTASALGQLARNAVFRVADTTSEVSMSAAIDEVVTTFGRLHVVCANAGVFVAADTPLVDIAWADVKTLVEVNLLGTILTLQKAIPAMDDGGAIVITASTSGLRAHPNGAVYAATKTAFLGLARSVAAELAPRRIRVNTVAPGAVRTPMLTVAHSPDEIAGFERDSALGRIAEPSDVADAFAFLASDAARHITGVSLRVDGGDCLLGAL